MLYCGGGIIGPDTHCVLDECMPDEPTNGCLFAAAVEANVRYPWPARRRLRRKLAQLDMLTVRDLASAQMLAQLGVKRPVDVIGDIVLWLEAQRELPPGVPTSDGYMAINLAPRWLDAPQWHGWIAEQLAHTANTLKLRPVFIPLSTLADDDRPEHRHIAERMRQIDPTLDPLLIEDDISPREVAAAIGGARFAIGMRLHACVIAFSQRVPFVGIAYHPKLIAFAQTVGLGRFVPGPATRTQDRRRYGYSFASTGLARRALAPLCTDAVETMSFNMLTPLKQKLADVFDQLMRGPWGAP